MFIQVYWNIDEFENEKKEIINEQWAPSCQGNINSKKKKLHTYMWKQYM